MERSVSKIPTRNIKSNIKPDRDEDDTSPDRLSSSVQGRDKAVGVLEAAVIDEYQLNESDNKRVLRLIDVNILPILLGVYFLQQLDKSTLAYASVFNLIDDTNLKGEDYSWLGSVVYIAQLVWQPLVAWILVRFPLGRVVLVAAFGWGTTLACMAAARNFAGLMVSRFALGSLESIIAPALIAITQLWWRREEQTLRISMWYCMNGVTNMIGSLLTYGLAKIDSPLRQYQVIFLFCGGITVLFSIVVFFVLADKPETARFLAKGNDRTIAMERIRLNQMGIQSGIFKWSQLWDCLADVKTWGWFCLILSISIPSGGIATFGPLIVEKFGFNSFQTILVNIPFGFVQLCATLGSALLSARFKIKGPFIALLCLPPITGCVMLLKIPHDAANRVTLLIGYYLISFYPAIPPLIYSWSSQNTAGDTKRKCNTAVLFIGQSLGNIVGPHLYSQVDAPLYRRGLISNLALYFAIIVITIVISFWLRHLNSLHRKERIALGGSGEAVDESMASIKDAMSVDEIETARLSSHFLTTTTTTAVVREEEESTRRVERERMRQKASNDETDLRNEYFVFVY